MAPHLQILLGIVLALSSLVSAQQPYCTPSSGSGEIGNALPLPDLPDVFQTKIEINFLEPVRLSQSIRQQFDYNRRLASIFVQSNNTESRLYFDYEYDQIHFLVLNPLYNNDGLFPGVNPAGPLDMPCESLPLSTTPLLNYYFGVERVNATYLRPKSVYDVLRFRNENFLWAYQNTEIVRGIPCDVWISCQYQPETQSNYTIKFYFSRTNYSMPHWSPDARYSRVPVRAEYQGVRMVQGTSQKFHEIFDYFDFVAGRADSSAFYTPESAICLGRNGAKELPLEITKRFRTSEEVIKGNQIETLRDFIFDEEYQLVKLEYRNLKKEAVSFFTTDPLTIVHDYNIGVSFAYNNVLRNCTITGITNSSFDEDADFTHTLENEHSYYVRMRSAKSVLFLDREYVYTGERYTSEGLRVKTYLSNVTNELKTSTVIDYSFTSDNIELGVDDEIEKVVPVSYSYTVENLGSLQANFYNFKTRPVSPHEFDTGMCRREGENLNILMVFPYKKYNLAANQVQEKEWVDAYMYKIIVSTTRETFTRFSRPKITISDDGNLYVSFEILPSPPPMALFTLIPGKWSLSTSLDYYYNLGSAEKCAGYCLENDDCLSFDFSNVTTSCFLNSGHAATEGVSTNENYLHYSRNTLKAFGSKPSYKVYDKLMEEYRNGNIVLKLLVPTAQNPSNMVNIPASRVDIVRPSNGFNGAGVFALSRFDLKFDNKKFASSAGLREYESLSIDECANACVNEPTFECGSFDYCFTNDRCRLSPKVASSKDTDYVEDFCKVYSQNQLFHYRQFPGRYSVNKKDINFKDVESAGDCAEKCDKADKIHCRSFNYCSKEKACYISESHLVDASDTAVADLLCTHFSRDYFSDFEFTSSAMIALEAEILYTGNSLEECSQLCVTADGFSCTSMDYCAKTKTCMLNSGQRAPKNETSAAEVIKDQCNNYVRKYFYATSRNLNDKPSSDSSSKVLLGLSLSFVAVSLIAGAVGGHFIVKKKFSN